MASTGAPKPAFVGAMDGELPIADPAAFKRATRLLLVDIPEHINECVACRKGDTQLDAALRANDHLAAEAASHAFCAAGNALIQEHAWLALKALGKRQP